MAYRAPPMMGRTNARVASVQMRASTRPAVATAKSIQQPLFRRVAMLGGRLGDLAPLRLRGGSMKWFRCGCIPQLRAVATHPGSSETKTRSGSVGSNAGNADRPVGLPQREAPLGGGFAPGGAELRDEQGEMIDRYMAEGKIIPVEVTARLLKEAIEKDKHKVSLFLIDGFPRNADNLDGWDKIVGDSVNVQFMLFMECSEEVMTERLLHRGETSGRIDDNAESIRKRFRTYQTETMPVILQFEKMDKLKRIDSGEPVKQVYEQVQSAFEPIVKKKRRIVRAMQWILQSVRDRVPV
eukprot:CAMPEP_0180407812 /NCGR_PEP_ID=MMETSP0989-20121125/41933_1 /TAXON_ID=697907 /ORGANISM="non described non described, Strain CCMP2293" /LENGTH=295 /DNA_ID=CAMNT_0022411689 /DNA_START=63 /DNA_END=951 /DNA_ORIENTATION=+